jgi:hypothetical protein
MDQENGWYDGATDSIILSAHITADVPHGVKLVKSGVVYIGIRIRGHSF